MSRLVVVLIVVFALTVVAVAPASAEHAWNGYHWARTLNPFTLTLGDNVTSAWDPSLATTSTDWSKSTVLDTHIVAGQSNGRRCRATVGRVEVCNGTYGNNGWLGVASVWVSGKHITQGTVRVNDTYFNTATYNTAAWRNLVMCQEVGHTLGLDHQDENFDNANLGTCMDYTRNPGTNQHPNQHDYNELEAIYSHLDSTNTVFATAALSTPSATVSPDSGESAGAWGRAVAFTANGRGRVYHLDIGGGRALVTFVLWAPDRAPPARSGGDL
jgi:hypothetical protein